jgi:hypothetical protein
LGRRLSAHWVGRIDLVSAYLFPIFALILVYRAFTV